MTSKNAVCQCRALVGRNSANQEACENGHVVIGVATAMTPAERKQAQRQRLRNAGLKIVELGIHPDDEAALQRYVARKNKRRGLL